MRRQKFKRQLVLFSVNERNAKHNGIPTKYPSFSKHSDKKKESTVFFLKIELKPCGCVPVTLWILAFWLLNSILRSKCCDFLISYSVIFHKENAYCYNFFYKFYQAMCHIMSFMSSSYLLTPFYYFF